MKDAWNRFVSFTAHICNGNAIFFLNFVSCMSIYTHQCQIFTPFQSMLNTGNMYPDICSNWCHFCSQVLFHGKSNARITKDKRDNDFAYFNKFDKIRQANVN